MKFFRPLTLLILCSLLLSAYAQDNATPVPLSDYNAAAEREADSATLDCEDNFKPIEHVFGVSCVPNDVQRIVTLETSMTEAIVTLGVEPVGVADTELFRMLVGLPLPADMVDVGSRREPNLERIAELQPDLIIGASWRMKNNYDELNAIAPTLAFLGSESIDVMADFLTKIAVALDKETEAEAHLAAMQAHFDEAAEIIAASDIRDDIILSQTWFDNDLATFRIFTDNAMPMEILERIGFRNNWDIDFEADGFSLVGIEALGDIGEDVSFIYLTDPESAPFYAESALWNSLPFVANGRAYRLNDDLWLFGGPLSAQRFVDAVLTSLELTQE